MSLEKTEAVVLKMFNWSESSRTVVFMTDRYGKLALIDRGGRQLKSKRGRLMQFTRMQHTFYDSSKGSGYISEADAVETFDFTGEGELGRLAYGSAGCELLYLLLPDREDQGNLYSFFIRYLRSMSRSDRRALPAVFVCFFLRLMSWLGYHPSLAFCIGCNEQFENGDDRKEYQFSPERGGLVCPSCQKPGEYYIGLSAESLRLLNVLQRASLDEAASLPLGFQEASLLVDVLTKFLKHHSALVVNMKSLAFLDKLKRTDLLP